MLHRQVTHFQRNFRGDICYRLTRLSFSYPIFKYMKRAIDKLKKYCRRAIVCGVPCHIPPLRTYDIDLLVNMPLRIEVLIDRPPGSHRESIRQRVGNVYPPGRERQELLFEIGQGLGKLDLAGLEEGLEPANEVELGARGAYGPERHYLAIPQLRLPQG